MSLSVLRVHLKSIPNLLCVYSSKYRKNRSTLKILLSKANYLIPSAVAVGLKAISTLLLGARKKAHGWTQDELLWLETVLLLLLLFLLPAPFWILEQKYFEKKYELDQIYRVAPLRPLSTQHHHHCHHKPHPLIRLSVYECVCVCVVCVCGGGSLLLFAFAF